MSYERPTGRSLSPLPASSLTDRSACKLLFGNFSFHFFPVQMQKESAYEGLLEQLEEMKKANEVTDVDPL